MLDSPLLYAVPDPGSASPTHAQVAPKALTFGDFEIDFTKEELRKDGIRIHLRGQPLEVLRALLESPGQTVTREELQRRLWSSATFVDFEHSLNAAVKRLREALNDSAESPRFIETLPRHGYRFIVPVAELRKEGRQPKASRLSWRVVTVAVLGIAVIALAGYWGAGQQGLLERMHSPAVKSVAVLPFHDLSSGDTYQSFADSMTDEVITELGRSQKLRVTSRQTVTPYKDTDKSLPQIARELHVHCLLQGSVLLDDHHVRITVQLVKAHPEEHLWAESYERTLEDLITLEREVAVDITKHVELIVTELGD